MLSSGRVSFYIMPVEGAGTKVGLCLGHKLALIRPCPHQKPGVKPGVREQQAIPASYKTPAMLLLKYNSCILIQLLLTIVKQI